jgi:hypothetical protein
MEIKVTPERDVPIIPIDTTYHGDFLLPIKKASFPAFFDVILAIKIKKPKYANRINITR